MADPEPRPGAILLTNTAQVGVNSSGYAVLHDPDYLLLETGTTDAMLLETGTTDGLLLEPYDCACCGDLCGACTDALPATATVDLGSLSLTGTDCSDECDGLSGQYILTPFGSCGFIYYVNPFCSVAYYTDYYLRIIAFIQFAGFGTPYWDVWIEIGASSWDLQLIYRIETGTICTGKTYTLPKISEINYGAICAGTWPETIDLIIP